MRCLLSIIFVFASLISFSQEKVSVAFWNVENLYDTIPSLFYDDSKYLRGGSLRWAEKRYELKLQSLASVIDRMDADVLALCEVESEEAVRDLVMTLGTDYCYIHRTTNDYRGMDIVMMYKGDRFIPERVRQIGIGTSRQALYVRGELCGERVDIVAVHMPSNLNDRQRRESAARNLFAWTDSLQRNDAGARVIILGDMNANPGDKVLRKAIPVHIGVPSFVNPLEGQWREGRGTYVYRGRWLMYDNIFLGQTLFGGNLRYVGAGIYIKEDMLDSSTPKRIGYPARTFSGEKYIGGASDHLPVFVILRKVE